MNHRTLRNTIVIGTIILLCGTSVIPVTYGTTTISDENEPTVVLNQEEIDGYESKVMWNITPVAEPFDEKPEEPVAPPFVDFILNYPPNGSTDIELNPELNVTVTTVDGSPVDVTFLKANANISTKHIIVDGFDDALAVSAVDIDGDGDIDVLGVPFYSDEIAWWENDGNEVFTKYVIASNFDGASAVYTADVDSDGDIDVLGTARYGDEIAWWENDGNEMFTKHVIANNFYGAYDVNAVDMDFDGDIDVLGAAVIADEIAWWENDGNEVFTKYVITSNFDWASAVYAVDMDGDGDIDVLGAARDGDEIAWWENNGNEIFTKHVIANNFNGAFDAYAADVDSDGDIDVLGAARFGDGIAWWENDGNEMFTKHVIASNFDGAVDVYTADVDSDGDIDVLGAAVIADEIAWWENNGNEIFTKHVIANNFNGASAVYTADVDSDGDIDVLGTARDDDEIAWWENNGNEIFTKHVIANNFNGAFDAYAADVDSDGDIDVLGAAYYSEEIAWWENDGNEVFTKHVIANNFYGAYDVNAVDMDDDGDIDVLGAAVIADEIAWWENDGNEVFTKYVITNTSNFNGASAVYTADVDSDGDIDVLGTARDDDEIAWWENNGNEIFTKHVIANNFNGAFDAYAADVDSDGDIDVLGAARFGDEIAWWENDGNEMFTKHVIASNFDSALDVYAVDMDDDGDIDVLGAAYYSDEIAWWENDGNEVFTKHVIANNFNGAFDVYAVDMDDDGDIDVLGVAHNDGEIAWWKNDQVFGQDLNVTSGSNATYVCSGLEESTTYSWRVIAEDVYGDLILGPIWSFTTVSPDIWVEPEEFNIITIQGGIVTENLMIGNDGTAILEFNITIFFDDMESGVNGWTHGGRYDEWELGPPTYTYGPTSSYSGLNCWGTDLSSTYEDYSDQWLMSPSIDLSTVENAILSFYRWYDIEQGYDDAYVDISTDGGVSWNRLVYYTGSGRMWKQERIDISSFTGHEDVRVRFRLESDYTIEDAGLYIDDVEITGTPTISQWLTITPMNGTVEPDNHTTLTITANATTLETGEYTRNISISSNDPDENPVVIPVNLYVTTEDHGVAVTALDVDVAYISEETIINATIHNNGLNNETNITVQLLINETIVNDTLIDELMVDEYTDVNFSWIPTAIGIYNVSVYAVPVPGETGIHDNSMETQMIVTTPPYPPSNPYPSDGATNVSICLLLNWTGGNPDPNNPVTYDVYFGTTTPPPKIVNNQTMTFYDLGILDYETLYYWQIVTWDEYGASNTSEEWQFTTEQEPEPDLDCDGSLSWNNVTPGDTVTGSFTVENNGEPSSKLDWEISDYPDWGTWMFIPSNGNDLTPEDGAVTIEVSVVAPDESEKEFSGEIKIVNSEDPSDFCIIDVSLATPVNQQSLYSRVLHFLQNLMQQFPMLEKIFSLLLGLNHI